jgi:hypothetical protein
MKAETRTFCNQECLENYVVRSICQTMAAGDDGGR